MIEFIRPVDPNCKWDIQFELFYLLTFILFLSGKNEFERCEKVDPEKWELILLESKASAKETLDREILSGRSVESCQIECNKTLSLYISCLKDKSLCAWLRLCQKS